MYSIHWTRNNHNTICAKYEPGAMEIDFKTKIIAKGEEFNFL